MITALKTPRRALLIGTLSLLSLAGCATPTPATQYSVHGVAGTAAVVDSTTAERLLAERIRQSSQGHVPTRLDAPLNPRRIVLPTYPSERLRQGVQGTVVVEITIGTDGKVSQTKVVSAPDNLLSEAAVQAIGQWVFDPPTKDGSPRTFRARLPLEFRLR